MSYILDALKKSEQERSRGEIPDIKSIHKDAFVRPEQKTKVWPYVLAAVLLLNVGVIYVYVFKPHSPVITSAEPTPSPVAQAKREETPVYNSVSKRDPSPTKSDAVSVPENITARQNPKVVSRNNANEPSKKSNVVFAKQPLSITATELNQVKKSQGIPSGNVKFENAGIIFPASELSTELQKQIPAISFEGHVYSSVVQQRSVMINGQKMREGQNVTNELVLENITPEGAVFSLRGHPFKLNALQDWNAK